MHDHEKFDEASMTAFSMLWVNGPLEFVAANVALTMVVVEVVARVVEGLGGGEL